MTTTIVWLRQDLRLSDHPALQAASERNLPVVPVYIFDEVTPGQWKMGGAQRWWLRHSLASLAASLKKRNLNLILRRGPALSILKQLMVETQGSALYWNRCYEPYAIRRDQEIKKYFTQQGIEVESFSGSLLFEPWKIANQKKEPYKVFTQFWKACLKGTNPDRPCEKPTTFVSFPTPLYSDVLDEWRLLPESPDWAKAFAQEWQPGEEGAVKRLQDFIEGGTLQRYHNDRDRPDCAGTSKLSPHLHFGEISPRQIWSAVHEMTENTPGVETFLSEIGWREFSYSLLYHFPTFPEAPFRPEFNQFAWHKNPQLLRAWQRGMTGYPIVDAGMRQLWTTGWMHNRVRMITASFLTKDLLIDWRKGEKWFWDTLVDADLANNSVSWQWTAGSGVDASPYFRIFNPVLQGEKFDPQGEYVRRWVPELKGLPAQFIHQPWMAPDGILQAAGVTLGKTYPSPVVDHRQARDIALKAYEEIKGKTGRSLSSSETKSLN